MASWQAIEGALAVHLITGPLHWLGIVDLETSGQAGQRLFRISPTGRELLAELATSSCRRAPWGAARHHRRALAASRSTCATRATSATNWSAWPSGKARMPTQARYWLSENAVWQAQNAGITSEQMVTFLRRITQDEVPDIVAHTLQAWGQRYGGASSEPSRSAGDGGRDYDATHPPGTGDCSAPRTIPGRNALPRGRGKHGAPCRRAKEAQHLATGGTLIQRKTGAIRPPHRVALYA